MPVNNSPDSAAALCPLLLPQVEVDTATLVTINYWNLMNGTFQLPDNFEVATNAFRFRLASKWLKILDMFNIQEMFYNHTTCYLWSNSLLSYGDAIEYLYNSSTMCNSCADNEAKIMTLSAENICLWENKWQQCMVQGQRKVSNYLILVWEVDSATSQETFKVLFL